MKVPAATLLLVLLVALALWRPWETPVFPESSPPAAPADRRIPPAGDPPVIGAEAAPALPPPGQVAPRISSAEAEKVREAIDNLELALRDYGAALGGNPVGTNAEITAALLGDNAKQMKLELPSGSSLNAAGELCDPWGTPWFFHQLAARRTELRSAGPDRKMYTEDDFVR